MIEVRVGHQHGIQRRKILDSQARPAQPLEDEEPGSKDGIDHNMLIRQSAERTRSGR